MRIVQKGKRIATANPTDELDRFLRRVQIKSRVRHVDENTLQIAPVQEEVKFNLVPSKCCYWNTSYVRTNSRTPM